MASTKAVDEESPTTFAAKVRLKRHEECLNEDCFDQRGCLGLHVNNKLPIAATAIIALRFLNLEFKCMFASVVKQLLQVVATPFYNNNN